MNKTVIINNILKNCHEFYDKEHVKLVNLGKKAKTEGEIRAAAGVFIENFLQNIFNQINKHVPNAKIISKVGTTDYLSLNIKYKGKKAANNQIQVDRHVFSKGKRIAFIENKTYLDSCYYDRALADFRKIVQSIKQSKKEPADCKYIVFAGQNAASNNKLFFYEAEFFNDIKHLTKNGKGVDVKIFFFLKGKRKSSLPLYKVKHELDDKVLKEFISYMLSLI